MKQLNDINEKLRRASPARASRRFLSFIIDSILLVIVTLLVFSGVFSITENTTSYKEAKDVISLEVEYYKEFTEESHIVEYSEKGTRISNEDVALKNLKRAICLSYDKFGNSQQPNFVIEDNHQVKEYGVASIESDNVSYFFNCYLKDNDPNGLIINLHGVNPIDYVFEVYKSNFGTDASFMFTFNKEASVPVLNTQVAYYIFHYLYVDSDDVIGQTGETYYNSYINSYSYMLEDLENKLLNSEPYYSEHYVNYVDSYCSQARYTNISLVVSIFISYLIIILLPKLIFKNGRSFGYKLLGLGVLNEEDDDNKWHVTLFKSLLDCIGFIYIGFVLYLFKPFYGVYDAMFLPIYPNSNINFGLVLLITSIIGVVNNVFILFTHYRQNLINILFKDRVVDIHYLDEGDNDDKYEGRSY